MSYIAPIFEDNHLLCLNKPGNLLTQDSGTGLLNLQDLAKEWLKEKYSKKGNVFLETVHRLDKPVSGAVLFAKTSKALSRLNRALREKKVVKKYLALVTGKEVAKLQVQKSHLLVNFLAHDHRVAKVVASAENGKRAELKFLTLVINGDQALLEIELITGRYHQIRAQLAHFGLPIAGDHKYGSERCFADGKIALHSLEMQLVHPVSLKNLHFFIFACIFA